MRPIDSLPRQLNLVEAPSMTTSVAGGPTGLSGSTRPGPWAGGVLDIEGHRGARGLVVENTPDSFQAALDAGVTGIELDVRLSADGELVVWHDPVLLPEKCRAPGTGLVGERVDELTLAQLRSVDVGSQTLTKFAGQRPSPGASISTLPEVIELGQRRSPTLWWTIEVKVDPTDPRQAQRRERLVEAVHRAVYDAGIERRCFIHSFDWAVLELSRALDPTLLRSALTQALHYTPASPWTGSVDPADHDGDLVSGALAVGANVLAPDFRLVDAELVRRAHHQGLSVVVWTVNEPADLTRMHALGVDGIVTDYPDEARQVLSPLV